MMRRVFATLAVLGMLLSAASTWATTIEYSFITGTNPVTSTGPQFGSGTFVSGTFTYDPLAPFTAVSGDGASRYNSSVLNLSGVVGGYSFSDPSGRTLVRNDNPVDQLSLEVDPPIGTGAHNLIGFTIGGFQLVNVRMFWLEGQLGITDFLDNQNLPASLPGFQARLALDFVPIGSTDPVNFNNSVFFDGSTIVPAGSNRPPSPNAGPDIAITIGEISGTIVQGLAGDADGDALQYRWLEGAAVLQNWNSVTNGQAPLSLGALPGIQPGLHNLVLEVRDAEFTTSDGMILTISDTTVADPLDHWQVRARVSGASTRFSGVAYGNGLFVAVGSEGRIRTSPDGVTWTPRASGTTNVLVRVAYGNNLFIAVGWGGTILTSPDGITWAPRNSGTYADLDAVTFGKNIFVATGGQKTILTSPDGVNWTTRTYYSSDRSPYATGGLLHDYELDGIVYENNTFVAVGGETVESCTDVWCWNTVTSYYSLIRTSPDGIAWTARTSPSPNKWLNGVTYGDNKFVAVGDQGAILISPDAISWTARTSPTTEDIYGVTYERNTFVAVGTNGKILTSADGITWILRSSGISDGLRAVTYGNATFVAVGYADTIIQSGPLAFSGPHISVSPQSRDFGNVYIDSTAPPQTFSVFNTGSTDLVVGTITVTDTNSGFSKLNDNCSGKTITSLATCTFQIQFRPSVSGPNAAVLSIPSNDPNAPQSEVPLQGTGMLYPLTVIKKGAGTGTVTSSPPGITCGSDCTERYAPGTTITLTATPGANSVFAGWSGGGCSGTAACSVTLNTEITVEANFASTDPLNNWHVRISGTTYNFAGIASGNGIFVAVAEYNSDKILTSSNGTSWTTVTLNAYYNLSGITFGNGVFVAVGSTGTVLTSANGTTWTKRTSPNSRWLYNVGYGNGTFVAVGELGTVETSPDGITWTDRTSVTSGEFFGVTYGNNTFVAVGWSGKILSSTDGVTWTPRTSGSYSDFNGVAYGNGTFVAVGTSGTILTSPDGITWTSRNTDPNYGFRSVTYSNGTFVAVGGKIFTSPDGINWSQRDSGITNWLSGVIFGNDAFVAVGSAGAILQSDPLKSGSETIAPTVTSFSIPATSPALTVAIKSFTATDNPGGTGIAGYLITESPAAPSDTQAGWSSTVPASYRFTTPGTKNLYAWAKDAAGNVSTSLSAPVTIGSYIYDDFGSTSIDTGKWTINDTQGLLSQSGGRLHFTGDNTDGVAPAPAARITSTMSFTSGFFSMDFDDFYSDNISPPGQGSASFAALGLGEKTDNDKYVRVMRGRSTSETGGFFTAHYFDGTTRYRWWVSADAVSGKLGLYYDGSKVSFFYYNNSDPAKGWQLLDTTGPDASGQTVTITPGWAAPPPLFIMGTPGGSGVTRFAIDKVEYTTVHALPTVTLADVISVLQVIVGMKPYQYTYTDLNKDGKISLQEVVVILQMIAGMR